MDPLPGTIRMARYSSKPIFKMEKDKALLQYYVKPGTELNKTVNILAEIPTELGNVLAKKYTYQLNITR
ncbi:MAG: hypothetical protein U9R60_07960 [Bacteroidota bacterium]|nr:hypothetical protein [Bacteroidota bacterium]